MDEGSASSSESSAIHFRNVLDSVRACYAEESKRSVRDDRS